MAKKNDNSHDPPAGHPPGDEAHGVPSGDDRPGRCPGEETASPSPRAEAAFDAVRRAEAELERARALCERLRREAAEQIDKVRAKRVGDVLDDVATLVRKFPGASMVVAGLVGFYLGRLLRR